MDIGKELEKAFNDGYEKGKRDAVRHGKWILYHDNQSKVVEADDCSVCGAQWLYGERYNYCPSCGAKMDGE